MIQLMDQDPKSGDEITFRVSIDAISFFLSLLFFSPSIFNLWYLFLVKMEWEGEGEEEGERVEQGGGKGRFDMYSPWMYCVVNKEILQSIRVFNGSNSNKSAWIIDSIHHQL